MDKKSKIYIAGHSGLVGSAIMRALRADGFSNFVSKSSRELNLVRQVDVETFFRNEKPEVVVIAAARVGGIIANRNSPTEFLYDNSMIEMNVIHAAAEAKVKKLLFMGSSCIYPKLAAQPMTETALLTGALEQTNEAYAIAKIAGLKLTEYYHRQYGQAFISAMPPNLYGPGDNFHPDHSHVIPGLIRRFHEAKEKQTSEVQVWGSGTPLREFLYVDDLAEGCVFLLKNYNEAGFINVGSGEEVTIAHLAQLIKKVVGYAGKLSFDASKPDGTPRKILDSSRIHKMGWKARTPLETGLAQTYRWYLENIKNTRSV